ncbi:MAG: hypothetical protein QM490_03670 [Candidatus Gracilibacteria bacterium]
MKRKTDNIICGTIKRNIKLPQKGKNYKNLMLEEGDHELKQVPILLNELINCLRNTDGEDIGYIGIQIKKVGDRLIEVGKDLTVQE